MTIEIVPFNAIPPGSPLARSWDQKVAAERNLYAMYQAPAWLGCTLAALPAPPQLLVVRDSPDAEPSSLTVVSRETVPLRFRMSRREFASFPLQCVEVLGGRALGELTHADYVRLTEKIFSAWPDVDGIYLKSIPDDCALWKLLDEHGWKLGGATAYRPDGARPFHYVEFPGSFEGYMGEFRKKQRYNLKRQVRLMAEGLDNSLEMQCIDSPGQIDAFLADVAVVTAKSWKAKELDEPAPEMAATPEVLRAVASAGLLRAYVLRARGAPAAYALGYRFNGIYHYANIGYDAALANYSPGAVLLLMMIEDLVDKGGVKFMNFGITDAGYKRAFGNRHVNDASVIILRPTLRNGVLRAAHQAFEQFKQLLRRASRRREPKPAEAE